MGNIDECQLTKFYQQRQDRLGMFFWVQAAKFNLPSIQVGNAIKQYLDYYNLNGDVEYLKVAYFRMLKELMESDKN